MHKVGDVEFSVASQLLLQPPTVLNYFLEVDITVQNCCFVAQFCPVHVLKFMEVAVEQQPGFLSRLLGKDPVRIQRPSKVSHKIV